MIEADLTGGGAPEAGHRVQACCRLRQVSSPSRGRARGLIAAGPRQRSRLGGKSYAVAMRGHTLLTDQPGWTGSG